jgi:hypothetical protein
MRTSIFAPRSLPSADTSDSNILAWVADFYRQALNADPVARTFLAGNGFHESAGPVAADLGYADRTLGKALMGSLEGTALRKRLCALGVFRQNTGHEHLNGCLVFLSADIEVHHPGNLQSYNRYSYVLNNPLVLTDPTGYEDSSGEGLLDMLKRWLQSKASGVDQNSPKASPSDTAGAVPKDAVGKAVSKAADTAVTQGAAVPSAAAGGAVKAAVDAVAGVAQVGALASPGGVFAAVDIGDFKLSLDAKIDSYTSQSIIDSGGDPNGAGRAFGEALGNLGIQVGMLAFGGEGLAAEEEGVSLAAENLGGKTLYRAVGPGELEDIGAAGGRYRVPAGGTEGKYFFNTPEQTSNFARMLGDKVYTTTSVKVSPLQLARGQPINPFGDGPGYFFRTPDIPSGPVTIFNQSLLP